MYQVQGSILNLLGKIYGIIMFVSLYDIHRFPNQLVHQAQNEMPYAIINHMI